MGTRLYLSPASPESRLIRHVQLTVRKFRPMPAGLLCPGNACAPSQSETSCGLCGFHVFGVFAEPRLAIAPGTVMEGGLSSTDVRCIAFPSLEHWSLQCAAVGKT